MQIDAKAYRFSLLASSATVAAAGFIFLSQPAAAQFICMGNAAGTPFNDSTGDGATVASNGVACGTTSQATGTNSTALGLNSQATDEGATATGANSVASGASATAIGTGAQATGANAIAIGAGNIVTGSGSGAIGDPNVVNGNNSYAIGNDNVIDANNAFVLGNNVSIAAGLDGAIALGDGSTVAAPIATTSTVINGITYSFAGGNPLSTVSVGAPNAERTITNVAAGRIDPSSTDGVNGSQLSATNSALEDLSANAVLYEDSSKSRVVLEPGGTIVTNVAAGIISGGSLDAVNGSQIYGLSASVASLAGGGAAVNADGTISAPSYNVQGSTYNDVGSALGAVDTQLTTNITAIANGTIGPVQRTGTDQLSLIAAGGDASAPGAAQVLTNVASGAVNAISVDAINGSQLYATASPIASALGGGSTVDFNGTITAPSYTVQGSTYNDVGSALGAVDTQLTTNINAINNGTIGPVQRTGTDQLSLIAIGGDASAPGSAQVLTNVAAGAVNVTSVDAVNGSQLYATASSTASALGGGSTVNTDGSISAPTYHIGGNTYNNVGDSLTNLDNRTTTIENNITGITNGTVGLVQQAAAGANLTVGKDTDGAAIDFAGTAGARKLINVADGTVAGGSNEGVNGGQLFGASQSTASALGGGTVVNADGSISAPSYTVQGSAYNNVGSALGAIDTQVTTNTTNITQLDSRVTTNTTNITNLGNQVATNTSNITGLIDGTLGLVQQAAPGADITVGAATDGTQVSFAGTAGNRKLTSVAAGTLGTSSTDAVNGSQLNATNEAVLAVTNLVTGAKAGAFASDNTSAGVAPEATGADASAGGNGSRASGSHALAAGNYSTATNTASTALGYAAQSSGANSVALGAGSTDGGAANVVSVGSAGGERRITNVAAGTNATDAVNVGQLNSRLTATLAQANSYTDNQIASIRFDLDDMRKRIDSGDARNAALGGIPQAFEPGQGLVGVGVGGTGSNVAIAVGASKAFDEHVVAKAGLSYEGYHDRVTWQVGAGFAF
ncbi:trimeric autotransporter adhesin [Novosphingobium sp. PhB165]|uniref:YadA-like family protein n=1 Tax=Novosphingobium sp. PhB165 TaxID=2485105 RepID=UPI00105214C9|nr:YadA-like family protein [Novosphingobium sp. PhB165]TCM14175.1 trimeric autotransporter adhesin [Novosphingobium sp. PhB165]